MPSLRPFRVVFSITAPVILNPSISLDGLLAAQTFERTGDHETAHLDLPLAQVEDLWQASEILLEGPALEQARPYVLRPAWEDFEFGNFKDGRGQTMRRIVARGAFKPALDAYQAFAVRRGYAFGVGDVDAVRDLLANLKTIGKKGRAAGHGKVAGVEVEAVQDAPDLLGLTDFVGDPARAIPLDSWRKVSNREPNNIEPARPHLPRWATPTVLCAKPASYIIPPHRQAEVFGYGHA